MQRTIMPELSSVITNDDISSISWPVVTIDFEASSLENNSYPIEVGMARWKSLDDPIEGWSTLIKPEPVWLSHGHWSPASQQVHGIQKEELAKGTIPDQTLRAANAIATGSRAHCDGGRYDLYWMSRLIIASKISTTFPLEDFDRLLWKKSMDVQRRVYTCLDRQHVVHRARADAEGLLTAFAYGITGGKIELIDMAI